MWVKVARGKSVTAKSIMKLNPYNAHYGDDTKITLHLEDGEVKTSWTCTALKSLKVIRGGAISMIFQEPMASFAPAITIGAPRWIRAADDPHGYE